MTICSPGFSPSDTSTCASPVGALTTILRLCTLLSSTTQTYMLFPSLSPKTALSGMIVQLSCTSGPTSAVKRMLQVKPGFTAYKSRSNEGSSIVMLNTRSFGGYVQIFLQSRLEHMALEGIKLYKETGIFGTEEIKICIRYGELDTQVLCVDQLYDPFS